MRKENKLERKASVEQNLVQIERDIKNLKEFFMVVLPILTKGGVINDKEIKNN